MATLAHLSTTWSPAGRSNGARVLFGRAPWAQVPAFVNPRTVFASTRPRNVPLVTPPAPRSATDEYSAASVSPRGLCNPPTPPAVGVQYLPPRVSNPPTPLAVGVLDPCPHPQAAATLGTSCLGATLLCISFVFFFFKGYHIAAGEGPLT